jgi:hypothetical protein
MSGFHPVASVVARRTALVGSCAMKKPVASLVLAGVLVLALSLTAHAAAPITPTVASVEPASAYSS